MNVWSTELIVPYGPGGAADIVGRAAAAYYEKTQSESIVIVNRPGAGGTIGTNYALKQHPDGKTLVVANSGSFVFNKVFYKTQPYDYSDFDIAGPYAQTPVMLAVSDTQINTIDEFIIATKKKKNFNCGTSSPSGAVLGRYILQQLKIDSVEIIIYRGSTEVSAALVGKQIDCAFDPLSSQLALYKNKNINIIAIASDQVNPEFVNVALFKDLVPDLIFYYWYGIAVPKSVNIKLRKTILTKFSLMYKDPEFVNTISTVGLMPVAGLKNPNQWIDQQYRKFDKMRELTGISKE